MLDLLYVKFACLCIACPQSEICIFKATYKNGCADNKSMAPDFHTSSGYVEDLSIVP